MSDQWKKEIAIAFMVKQRIWELDQGRLWPFHYPELAATEAELVAVEERLGYPLAGEYRSFLSCANGWQGFYQRVDLFGTSELLGGLRMAAAAELLEWLEEDVLPFCGFAQTDLLPIAVSRDDMTLFCLSKPSHPHSGQVFWFSGKLIETFVDFREFFLAMCDYNRKEVGYLLGEQGTSPQQS
jgi:hypothetical protein